MRIVHDLEPARWKQFVDENPCGNIFHTPEMFEVFSHAKGHHPVLWAAVREDCEILALLPVVNLILFDGLLRKLTSRAVAYGSVLCAPGEQGQAGLEALLEAYQSSACREVLFTEFRNLSDMANLNPVLNGRGFAYEDHLNYLHDLTLPEEILWRQIDQRKRSKIRLCRSKEVVVEEMTEREQLALAYHLVEGVYDRVQVPLADISLFQAAFEILAPRGMFRVLFARVGESYAATSMALTYHGRVYWWYIGSDRSFGNCGTAEALVWHGMQWGKAHGFEVFDFGGGGKPDQEYAPRQFKRQFGGVQVNYGRNVCVHSPLRMKLSEFGYRVYRRLFMRLIPGPASQPASSQ